MNTLGQTDRSEREPDTILRFRASERWVHCSIAIPFMICFTTALILVLAYNPDPFRPLPEKHRPRSRFGDPAARIPPPQYHGFRPPGERGVV